MGMTCTRQKRTKQDKHTHEIDHHESLQSSSGITSTTHSMTHCLTRRSCSQSSLERKRDTSLERIDDDNEMKTSFSRKEKLLLIYSDPSLSTIQVCVEDTQERI